MVKDDFDFLDTDEVEPTVVGPSPLPPANNTREDKHLSRERTRQFISQFRYPLAIGALVLIMLSIELISMFRSGRLSVPLLSDQGAVAKIISINGDTRYQPFSEDEWYKAKVAADAFVGDALFAGKSSDALVEMGSGGQLRLGEETLVVFESDDGITVPDVVRGNVRLKITGDMRITISGNSAIFSAGDGAEVLVTVEEGRKGRIQVLSGKPRIQTKGQPDRVVQTGSSYIMDLLNPVVVTKDVRPPMDVIPEPNQGSDPPIVKSVDPVVPAEQVTTIAHNLTKGDIYEAVNGIRLKARNGLEEIRTTGLLRWTGGNGTATFVQVAQVDRKTGEANFDQPWLSTQAAGQDLRVDLWRVGRSAWRVSMDGKSWSQSAIVEVVPRLAAGREPMVTFERSQVRLPDAVLPMRMNDSSQRTMLGWIIEGSRDPQFRKSIIAWADSDRLLIPLSKVGRYYFRVRSVDQQGELSGFSTVQFVDVLPELVKPKRPDSAPLRLAKKKKSVDEGSAKGAQSETGSRDVAAQESGSAVSTKIDRKSVSAPFKKAGPWSVSILGGLSSVISGVQVENGEQSPSVDVFGLIAGYFDGVYEGHIDYRSRLGLATNSSAPDITRLDLRFGRWWTLGARPLGIKTRVGVITGFENYSNKSGRGSFAPFYDFAKFGVGLGFDVTPRIQTGGSVLYGTWTTSDRMTEIDGYLAYDIDANLNLGFGYRVGLFEAGSVETSPNRIVPYREASGEAYSRLKISF